MWWTGTYASSEVKTSFHHNEVKLTCGHAIGDDDDGVDFLMAKPPLWFQALVWSEMLIQLPFFFVAVYAFAKCTRASRSCVGGMNALIDDRMQAVTGFAFPR